MKGIEQKGIDTGKFPYKLIYLLTTPNGSHTLHEDIETALVWGLYEDGSTIEVHTLGEYGLIGRMELEHA